MRPISNKNLYYLILASGKTNDDIADEIGVTRQYITRLLRDNFIPRGDVLLSLAAILSCDPRDICGMRYMGELITKDKAQKLGMVSNPKYSIIDGNIYRCGTLLKKGLLCKTRKKREIKRH